MNVNIDIEQIKILLDLNIPNKKEPVELTSQIIFYHNKTKEYSKNVALSKYPFFTMDIKYEISKIKKLYSYDKIVKFFFNKSYLLKKIYSLKLRPARESNKMKTVENNIKVMMKLLFPTTYPIINNYDTSYDKYIVGQSLFVSNLFNYDNPNTNFSYLKIDDKVYTITKVLWLNDMFNHPLYRVLIDGFINYKKWAKNENEKIKDSIIKTYNSIISNVIINKTDVDSYTKYNDSILPEDEKDGNDSKKLHGERFRSVVLANFIKSKKQDLLSKYGYKYIENLENFNSCQNYLESIANIFVEKPSKTLQTKDENEETIISTILSNITTIYNDAYGIINLYEKNKINIPQNILSKIQNLKKQFTVLNSKRKIIKNYITNDNININYEDDDPEIVRELQKYKKFTDFVSKLKQYIEPTRTSGNADLQDMINNLFLTKKQIDPTRSSTDTPVEKTSQNNDLEQYIELIKKKFILQEPTLFDSPRMNISLNYININEIDIPKYEIYMAIDVIEGEVTDENVKSIQCYYKNNYLVNELEHFMGRYNIYEANSNRVFISLNDIKKTTEPSKKEKQKRPTRKITKKGGNLTRKLRKI